MRLIDADKLNKDVREVYTDEFLAEYGFDKLINAQPTVYNLEKVVEELEKEIEDAKDDFVWIYAAGMERALEIVQNGGKE